VIRIERVGWNGYSGERGDFVEEQVDKDARTRSTRDDHESDGLAKKGADKEATFYYAKSVLMESRNMIGLGLG